MRMAISLRWMLAGVVLAAGSAYAGEEPDANPFGDRQVGVRADAVPGALYVSDGTIIIGDIYLTRDKKFRGFVKEEKQHHWVPLQAVTAITTVIEKEWEEKHWRWLENANDEKVYTGRTYPVRMYEYDLTLKDGQTLRVSRMYSPIYIRYSATKKPLRIILHHRNKGKLDQTLEDMVYTTKIELGPDAKKRALVELAKRLREAEEARVAAAAAAASQAAASQAAEEAAASQPKPDASVAKPDAPDA